MSIVNLSKLKEVYKGNAKIGKIYKGSTLLWSSHTHNWRLISASDATCNSDGFEYYECAECGDSRTVTLPALGYHVYENGQCIYCGITNSDYIDYEGSIAISLTPEEYNQLYGVYVNGEEVDLSNFYYYDSLNRYQYFITDTGGMCESKNDLINFLKVNYNVVFYLRNESVAKESGWYGADMDNDTLSNIIDNNLRNDQLNVGIGPYGIEY